MGGHAYHDYFNLFGLGGVFLDVQHVYVWPRLIGYNRLIDR